MDFLWIVYTVLFFGLHMTLAAALGTMLLLFSNWFLVRMVLPSDRLAGLLLVPYLLWILYALYLSLGIVALN